MPNLFQISEYSVFFWTNEGLPLEPLHVHVAQGRPSGGATKIWITSDGKCIISNNNSRIPEKMLNKIIKTIEANAEDIKSQWLMIFGEVRFYSG